MVHGANSIKKQLEWATKNLFSISCSAGLDSEVLLAFCLNKNRSYLLTWPEKELTAEQLECFREIIKKRLQPQPVAYLTGSREFYSMELNTTPDTLVPRPETELIVDTVLDLLADLDSPQILEMGTGTGAIALALKKYKPKSNVLATDFSQGALDVARSNATKHDLTISFEESNWYQHVPERKFDVIVSNPPYIAEDDPYLSQGDLPAEPIMALSSGETGLEALEVIIQDASSYLNKDGWIVLEHGYNQQQQVVEMLEKYGFNSIKTLTDYNDLPRVSLGLKI
ncbi:MAG: peptide chain release factor N(5)-glutamine methyltransferase [Gammaproteobacteria bacterium]|nr:peptide chain release factor N(5)-glutamine methyltransferase [Gammaproteobacteria bacterium]